MTEKNWMDRAKEEDLAGGESLSKGDNFIYFDEILSYDRIEDTYDGKPTTRFKILFKDERDPLFLPKSVFKRLTEELKTKAVGVRVTRDGDGIKTKYAVSPLVDPRPANGEIKPEQNVVK